MGFNYKELVLGEEFADLLRAPATNAEPSVDMEALGESLIANLNKQLDLYTAYLAQAERQRLSLVNRKLDENYQANVESEKLIGSLSTLEVERIAITEKILGPVKGVPAGKPQSAVDTDKGGFQAKCETLYPLLSPARAERLKACRDALVKATGELKRILTINMALAENGSRIIHTTIGILTSVVGRKQYEKLNTYTSKGNVRMGKMQIRNLINRSV
jgi:hypothetical protein